MATRFKLTKDRVNKMLAEHMATGAARRDVYDTEIKGFLVRLSGTKAVYCVAKRCNGRMTRVVIGDHGVFLPDHNDPKLNARKRAAVIVADIEAGVNPNEAKKTRREQGITVAQALENYFLDNPNLKENTIKIYRGLLQNHAADWMNKPVKSITPEMVLKKHTEITRKGFKESANKFVRTVRAVFYANKRLLPENPARIPRTKWNPSERRTGVVQAHLLPAWYLAVIDYRNQDIADYLMLLLLTGLRRSEGFSLRWEDIDLKGKTLIARDTKNGKDHTLPLSNFLCDLLKQRKETKVNEYVFPSLTSESGHLVEPKKAVAAISEAAGFKFNPHDLRRTFMSAAASLGISETLIKRLVNHSITDVTGGYIFDFENSGPHRKMQEITDLILGCVTRPVSVLLAAKTLIEKQQKQVTKIVNLEERRRVPSL
ncbi:tyrosine-type recombinase/integrase [Geomonas sp. RF6]|uniref:tyrosine-type recombinase/integrase n=1 Tax=Geomonas sp. RF6 TaxID=2897342 RepID=UPI001E2A2A17|nr:tyrosine-type recombinase/integrase [Geomonas sp. RF6]UFS69472.1 tyrosine-type recombinase/integrase [Geomonas sp. RF6]